MLPLKQRTYELMRSGPGSHVLDVGCGPGVDTSALGVRVGSTGKVVGVDTNCNFVREADNLAEQSGVRLWVEHLVGDAERLALKTGTFDACRCERVLQHVSRPDRVVFEMVRVTRDGGWIVALDIDWATLSIDVSDVELERRLVRFHLDAHRSGSVGRQLWRLFKQAGLSDISLDFATLPCLNLASAAFGLGVLEMAEQAAKAGAISSEAAAEWREALLDADAKGVFFASVNAVFAVGRKAG